MTTQLELFAPELSQNPPCPAPWDIAELGTAYAFVDCRNPKTGSEWAHLVADPEETVRMVRAMGFEAERRER